MATGTRDRPGQSQARVLLREDFARGTLPLKVDREAGVIHGVKVVGLTSPNTHGVAGAADGTVYSPEALRKAAPLYEGVAVNVDHPDRARPKSDRSSLDRFGKLQNVRAEPDGLYADLHYLKSHPLAERVCEAAERMPELFALSHNAYGRGSVQEGRYVVTEIPEVRSVDLVADGGTNKSLFESHQPMTKKFRDLVESAAPAARAQLRKLLEMYEDDMGDMEVADAGAGAGLNDHLGNAILAIMQSVKAGDMSPEDGKKKVLAAYKLSLDEDDGKDDDKGDDKKVEEDDEGKEEGVVSDNDKDADEGDQKKPAKAQESRRKKAPAKAVALTEARAASWCRLAGVEPAAELLEALLAIGDEDKALKHLTYLKGLAGKGGQKPRTQHVREARDAGHDNGLGSVRDITDGKAFAALLRRGLN